MKVKITGTGSCLPKLRVTNDDLGQIMETSDEWIRSRTGIIARHIAVEETTTGMSTEAAGKALKNAEISAEDVVHLEVPGEQDGDDDQKQHDAPADHHGFRHLQAAEGDHLHIQLLFQGRSQCVHLFASFLSRVLS